VGINSERVVVCKKILFYLCIAFYRGKIKRGLVKSEKIRERVMILESITSVVGCLSGSEMSPSKLKFLLSLE
jgi:hypothetical protein